MKRLVAVFLLPGIGIAGSWACGDSTGSGSIAGTYNLVSVDGRNLPCEAFVYQDATGSIVMVEYASGSLRLDGDGAYSRSTTFRETHYDPLTMQPTGQVTTDTATSSGSWTHSGSTVSFTDGASGESFTGTLSGDVLTIGGGVYRR